MKLSAKSRYAARILIELAKETSHNPMSASTLSLNTGVSVQFVEQILKPLKQKGLTKSIRGAAGGHRLARAAADITLGEVVRLMEGGIQLTVCCSDKKVNACPRAKTCPTRSAWKHVSTALEKELEEITIASLLQSTVPCPVPSKRGTSAAAKAQGGIKILPLVAVTEPALVQSAEPAIKVSTRKVKGLIRAPKKK